MDLALIIKVTIALTIGLSATAAARRSRASVRHLILATTFAAVLAIPVVPSVLPDVEVAVPSARAAITAVVADVSLRETATRVVERVTTTPPSASGMPVATWLTLIWAAGALTLTGLLASALLKLRGLRRTAIPWQQGQVALDLIARESGVKTPVEVLRQDQVGAPVTWGVRRPVVLLPADAPQWDQRELRQAFLHELEHVHRRDWIVQVVARAVCAVYWFHPLVWIAWRQLCLDCERACDDAVLRRADGTEYAQQLVLLAQRVSGASAIPMLSMAGRSDLSVRVRALLDTTIGRGRAGRRTVLGASVLAATIVLAMSPLRAAQPTTSPATGADAAKAMAAATFLDSATEAIEMKVESLQDSVVDTLRGRPSGSRGRRAMAEALIESAGDGNLTDVTALLNSGLDVNTVLEGDGTALIAAARRGEMPMVRLLVDRGADVNLAVRGDGNPLIMAAAAGAEDVVRYLLDRGADIEAIVPGDENPLINASANGHLAVVKLLVSRGANVNAGMWVESYNVVDGPQRRPQREWRSPLSVATRNRHRAVVDFLRGSGAAD